MACACPAWPLRKQMRKKIWGNLFALPLRKRKRNRISRFSFVTTSSQSHIHSNHANIRNIHTGTKIVGAPKLRVLKVPRTCDFETHRFWYRVECQKNTQTGTKSAGAPELRVLTVPRTCDLETHWFWYPFGCSWNFLAEAKGSFYRGLVSQRGASSH